MSNLLYIIPTNSTSDKNIDKSESSFFADASDMPENSTDMNVNSEDGKKLLFVENQTIINYAKHETAKTLAMKINTLFQLYLKSFIGLDKTKLNDVTKLEDDFNKLYSMIDKNSSPAEIMKKVHIDIQPTMQKVYNLKIKMQQT